MKIIAKFTALSNIVAAIASVNGIPIMFAVNIFIASPIPKFPGVIAIIIDKFEIAAMNNAFASVICIPNIWYAIKLFNAMRNTWINEIKIVIIIIFLLFFIKCQPFITLINLFSHLLLFSFIFGEKIIIESKKIVKIDSANKIGILFSCNVSIEKIPVRDETRKIKMYIAESVARKCTYGKSCFFFK